MVGRWEAAGVRLTARGQNVDIYVAYLSPSLYELSESEMYAYFEQAEKDVGKREPLKKCVASGAYPARRRGGGRGDTRQAGG